MQGENVVKNLIKRCGILALVLALVCTVLAGCGSTGNGENPSADQPTEAGGKTKLILWSTYGTYGTQYMKELVNGFNDSQDQIGRAHV